LNIQLSNQTPFDIDSWYQQPIGKNVAALEKQQINLLPKNLLGPSILHLGTSIHCNGSHIHNKQPSIIVKPIHSSTACHVRSSYADLPFAASSFDTIILPHILECTSNPKAIILESWQTLAPEGHLIILGFNPFSFNHLWYLFDKTKLGLPEHAKFYSINKIFQWLKNESYEVISTHNFCYQPITPNLKLTNNWVTLEKLANWLLPSCGGLYLLILKKRVLTLTPLRLRWSWRDLLNDKDIVEPAAGNLHRE
jgi:SAM-dependent methyltransferase